MDKSKGTILLRDRECRSDSQRVGTFRNKVLLEVLRYPEVHRLRIRRVPCADINETRPQTLRDIEGDTIAKVRLDDWRLVEGSKSIPINEN